MVLLTNFRLMLSNHKCFGVHLYPPSAKTGSYVTLGIQGLRYFQHNRGPQSIWIFQSKISKLSSNHLHSPGDLSLEFCIYSWHTEMHFLAENTSSSVGRTREGLPLNRLTPLLQPIFAILGCAAMYTDLALGHTYNLMKHAEAIG